MDYELAKQLKDAGFWSNGDEPAVFCDTLFNRVPTDEQRKEHWFEDMAPTLSELIEACGGYCKMLLNGAFLVWNSETKEYEEFEGWFAGNCGTYEDGGTIYDEYDFHGYGKTPEEAVAKLWLEINT